MAVPNTNTFTLANVCDEIGLTGGNRTLSNCFSSAVSGGFDPTYGAITDDDLLAFRNYSHSTPVTITPSAINVGSGSGSHIITVTTTETWTAAVTLGAAFISFIGSSSGSGNGSFTISLLANGSGIPRFGQITVSTPSSSDTTSVTQGA